MIFQNRYERELYDRKQLSQADFGLQTQGLPGIPSPRELVDLEVPGQPNTRAYITKVRGSDLQPSTEATVRTFGTGATRDLDANKLDFEGFLSPLVMERYAQHMHKARAMADGTMRDSDNWQLGIPLGAYMKSMWRHFFDVWKTHRGVPTTSDIETELCALLFNVNGYLHEHLKAKKNV